VGTASPGARGPPRERGAGGLCCVRLPEEARQMSETNEWEGRRDGGLFTPQQKTWDVCLIPCDRSKAPIYLPRSTAMADLPDSPRRDQGRGSDTPVSRSQRSCWDSHALAASRRARPSLCARATACGSATMMGWPIRRLPPPERWRALDAVRGRGYCRPDPRATQPGPWRSPAPVVSPLGPTTRGSRRHRAP